MIDDKVAYSWARNAHILMGGSFVLIAFMFGGWKWECGIAMAITIWAFIKEVIWDPKYETVAEQGSGVADFCEYAIGVGIALIICGIKQHFG